MTQLSKDLRLADMTRSATAIAKKIDNSPSPQHLIAMQAWAAKIYQPLADHFGIPPFVSSGYRSPALNAVTKGSSAISQHAQGEAGDLDQDSQGTPFTNADLFDYIRQHLPFDQLIWEYGTDTDPAWVHVSFSLRHASRKQVLRTTGTPASPTYAPFTR